MYAGPIIDAHHHLWDLSLGHHPWLRPDDPSVQALAGLSTIAHDYLVGDYRRDAAKHDIVATVHVEALWAGEPVGETRWLEGLDKSGGVALRYVAGAALGTPSSGRIIAEQAAFPRVVGVRGILSHHPDPRKSFVADPRLAYDADWRRDVALLSRHGLHLELMMYPYQAEAVRDLGLAFPDLTIVVNHCGSPIDRDSEGLWRWREAIRTIAALPNLAIKVSNPGAYDPQWTAASIGDVVLHCLDCFGPDRVMFGTDYPVSRIQMNFDQICETFKTALRSRPEDEQRKFFHDNARRYYRL